jgi:UDP-glucose 4-epimerase
MNLKDITKSRILVAGGMGYVGSFTCKKFLKKYKTKLISIDNLSRSNKYSQKFCNNYKCDVANEKKIQKILLENKISTIIDLASYTCVRESIKRPYYYKNNNLLKQIKFIKTAKQCGVKKFIFSSSLSIYEKNKVKKNLSPYSKYKLEIENF